MPEAQEALDTVKQLLTKAPILVPPTNREPLLLYIAATTQVVSAALMVVREEEGHALKVQRHVYFISEVLSDSRTCYPQRRAAVGRCPEPWPMHWRNNAVRWLGFCFPRDAIRRPAMAASR